MAAAALLVAIIHVGCRSPRGALDSPVPSGEVHARVRAAVSRAAAASGRAAVLRDTAVRATENAMAAQEDAHRKLIDAVRRGAPVVVMDERAALKQACAESIDAAAMAGDVIRNVHSCFMHAEKARAYAGRALATGADIADRSAAELTRREAESAEKSADRAEAVMVPLKERWLLPGGSPEGRP